MTIQEIKKFISKTLKKNRITIHDSYDVDESTFYVCDAIILILDHEKREINVCFHISMKPDISALISLLLTKIKYTIIINNSFIYDKDGRVIDGNKAEDIFRENITNKIVGDFINQQNQLFMLNMINHDDALMN